VINIGGIHSILSKEVSLPAVAAELGLVVGQEYPLDFFQAERHVTQSNLRIDTTLELKPRGVN
jgi:fibro-slime domain-containing protein